MNKSGIRRRPALVLGVEPVGLAVIVSPRRPWAIVAADYFSPPPSLAESSGRPVGDPDEQTA